MFKNYDERTRRKTCGKHNFFRCAKGYLVNMNHVEGFVGSDCVIHNVHIPVSRTRKKDS